MERQSFKDRLTRATNETVQFTRNFVVDELPENYQYRIFPNKHGAAKKLVGDAEVYPEDSLPPGQFVGPLDASGVTDYLWRNGKVPEWINIGVAGVEDDVTVISLICCGHFTSLPVNGFNAMVDRDFEGHTPFAIHGPPVPPRWKRTDPKFEFKDSPKYDW